MTLAAPEAVPPIVFPGAFSIRTPSTALGRMVSPPDVVPIRFPSSTLPVAAALRIRTPMLLPEITLPAAECRAADRVPRRVGDEDSLQRVALVKGPIRADQVALHQVARRLGVGDGGGLHVAEVQQRAGNGNAVALVADDRIPKTTVRPTDEVAGRRDIDTVEVVADLVPLHHVGRREWS